MASNSGWSKGLPSGSSALQLGDNDIRSNNSVLQAAWEEEHYFTDGSAGSAGVHKLGSARVFVGTTSHLSNPTGDNDGRVMFTSDTTSLYVAHGSASTWKLVSNDVRTDSNISWTGNHQFDGDVKLSTPDMSWAVTNIVSGFTVLAADFGLAGGGNNVLALGPNTGSTLTVGDPITVGSTTSGGTPFNTTGYIDPSTGSVFAFMHNPSGSRFTINSGTTLRYVGFASS